MPIRLPPLAMAAILPAPRGQIIWGTRVSGQRPLLFAGADHVLADLHRLVADDQKLFVAGGDQAVVLEAAIDPLQQRCQKSEPTRITGKCWIRSVWIRVRASNISSRVPKPPGMITKARA